MFTRLRLLLFSALCLMAASSFTGKAESWKVTSKERIEYQNQISHFLQETYYATLCLAMTEEDIHTEVAEDLMAEDAVRYQPEFYLNSKRQRYMSPAKYLQELVTSYKGMDGEQVEFSVSNMVFGRDFKRYHLSGCHVQVDYDLTIRYQDKILAKRRCRMICLFPKASYSRRILALQVESVKDHYLAEPSAGSVSQSGKWSSDRASKRNPVVAKEKTHANVQSGDDAKGVMGNLSQTVAEDSADAFPMWQDAVSKVNLFSWIDWLVIILVFTLSYLLLDGWLTRRISSLLGWDSTWLDEEFLEFVREFAPTDAFLRALSYGIVSLLSAAPLFFVMPIPDLDGYSMEMILFGACMLFIVYAVYEMLLWLVGVIVCFFFSCVEKGGFVKGVAVFFMRVLQFILIIVVSCCPLTYLYLLVVYLANRYEWKTVQMLSKKVGKAADRFFDFTA